MGLNKNSTTLAARSNLDQIGFVAAAFLFILGFIVPSSLPWQLAGLVVILSIIYAIGKRFFRPLPMGVSPQAHRIPGARQPLQ
jgi:hypothetical protein